MLVDYQEQIVNIVQNTKKMRNSDTIEKVNSLYQETIKKINKLYWQIIKDFCIKNDIPPEFMQNKIRSNCKINKLIIQFEEIEKEYKKEQQKQKEEKINKKIEETTNNYKSYTGYAVLEENIKSIIKNFIEEVKEKQLEEIVMEPLCQEIEALFATYYKNIEKINTILKEDLTEEEKREVRELNTNILNADFEQMYQKWRVKRERPKIIKLYEDIRRKATAASLEMLKNNNIEGLIAINQKEKEIIEIIQKVQVGELSIKELNKIDFLNSPTTENVLTSVEKQLIEEEVRKKAESYIEIEAINNIYEEEHRKNH